MASVSAGCGAPSAWWSSGRGMGPTGGAAGNGPERSDKLRNAPRERDSAGPISSHPHQRTGRAVRQSMLGHCLLDSEFEVSAAGEICRRALLITGRSGAQARMIARGLKTPHWGRHIQGRRSETRRRMSSRLLGLARRQRNDGADGSLGRTASLAYCHPVLTRQIGKPGRRPGPEVRCCAPSYAR